MATATVVQFMQKTAEDAAFRQQLEAILGVGDGDISSEAEIDPQETEALKGERAPLVADFAVKNGYQFSVADLITVVNAFEEHQSGEISDGELNQILGVSDAIAKHEGGLKRLGRYLSKTYLGVDLT